MIAKKGKNIYPTLAQKHLNGADRGSVAVKCVSTAALPPAKEAVQMARWLKTVCLEVAGKRPTDDHAAWPAPNYSAFADFSLVSNVLEAPGSRVCQPGCYAAGGELEAKPDRPVGAKEPGSVAASQLPVPLCVQQLPSLQRCAHEQLCRCSLQPRSQGLAQEAIREERLLWKIRPKHHKRLNSKYLRGFLCLSA